MKKHTKEIYVDPWPGSSGGYSVSFYYGSGEDPHGMDGTLTLDEALLIAKEYVESGLGPIILDGSEMDARTWDWHFGTVKLEEG
jgi:hypothetical protein